MDKMSPNVLITGGTGFAGYHLLEFYKKKKYKLFCFTRSLPNKKFVSQFQNATFVSCDLTDIKRLSKVLNSIKFKYVYHLAAQSLPALAEKNTSMTFESNVLGTMNLLKCLVHNNSKAKILFTSSNLVYGDAFNYKNKLRESEEPRPNNNYGLSKLMAERICNEYTSKGLLDIRIARSFNHFGLKQNENLAFSNWISQILKREGMPKTNKTKIIETGNLKVRRDFLHVKDVIRAYELILHKGKAGETYNVCSSKDIALKVYLRALLQASSIPLGEFRVVQSKNRMRKNDVLRVSGNNQKLKALGWKQEHDTLKGLADLLSLSRQ